MGPQRAGSSTGATDLELSGVELLLNEPEIVAWLGGEAPEREQAETALAPAG
jgi:hypothetical protein